MGERSFLEELKRRRMFRAMAAYFVVAWLLLQVANVTFPPLGLPDWTQRALIIGLGVGIIPAFILSWLYDLTSHGIVRTGDDDAAGKGKIDAVDANTPAPKGDASIAILPFVDLSPGKDQDWFCDGLAAEIIDALVGVRQLRVASRTASFRFRDGAADPSDIGRRLHVGAVLEGSVRKAGDLLRITAQLIDASSGFHLWSETWDRRLEDVFAIQSEIARKVASALRVSLTGEQAARAQRYAPRNMQAHEFYLRARQLVSRISPADWRQAPVLFRRAIELDPTYAQAHAGLADALTQLLLWQLMRPEEALAEATRAANRALDLAPDLAEAHVAMGHVRSLTGDHEGAQRSFERALELNPDLFDAHYFFARHCIARGDYARAIALYRSAFALRPDDHTVPAQAVQALDQIGDPAGALVLARQTAAGLKHQLELEPNDARANYLLAVMLARMGQREAGIPYVETALRLRPGDYATLYNAACYYSLAGSLERALDLLEEAARLGGGNRDWIEHDADLDPLRSLPRFKAFMQSMPAAADAARE
ncbi:MAG: tetratricopeptide repeat protein [Proteobacteria bacterium]|nr:tetratricopeptide repeat protein [Pseudomonadota bacterium]MBS0465195.1 tetratricopeptide repeat protein [Pseudomonadota bacterium]